MIKDGDGGKSPPVAPDDRVVERRNGSLTDAATSRGTKEIRELEDFKIEEFLKTTEQSLRDAKKLFDIKDELKELIEKKSPFDVLKKVREFKELGKDIREATGTTEGWLDRLEEEFSQLSEADRIVVGATGVALGLVAGTIVGGAFIVGGGIAAGGSLLADIAGGLALATHVTRISLSVGLNTTKAFLNQGPISATQARDAGIIRTTSDVAKSFGQAVVEGVRQTTRSEYGEFYSDLRNSVAIPLP